MSFLRLTSVRKSYGPVLAVDGVDLDVAQGSHIAIVGPSASGKSTLLRLIAGFEEPDRGEVSLDGVVLAGDGHMVPAHKRGIGYVAQDGALFPHLTIGENVGFGIARREPDRDARISQLLKMVGLDASIAARRPDQLSGGQQQRVSIARAMAQRPRLMLLDEPFSALDTNLRIATRKAVTDILRAASITTVLVTHDQAEALSFADRVAVMHEARLVQFGTPRDLYERPATQRIAAYLGDAVLLSAVLAGGVAECALGRLASGTADARGEAKIMIRPEQIQLMEIAEPDAAGDGCVAKVVRVDFGGGANQVTVELRGPAPTTLLIRQSQSPTVGAWVRLTVHGRVHVFDPDEIK